MLTKPFAKQGPRLKHRARFSLLTLESRLAPAVVNVDATANVHPINPLVYGTAFATTAQLTDLRIPINRNGGNASDTYSYPNDATNHASDWFFESIVSGSGNGQGMDSWISDTKAGGAQPSVTVNLFDWAAKLGSNRSILGSFGVSTYGAQQSLDPWWPNWGNGVRTNGTNITGNNPNDAYTAHSPAIEQNWIQHLINTFGDSQHGGVQYYTMGNEPGLWNSTHRDIHPAGVTLTELRDRIIAYASMIKSLDPGAKILGTEEWGWTNYFISGADAAASNWGATYNGLNAQAWLLDQLRQYDTANGTRLLDYFTLHYYPQGGEFGDDVSQTMQLLRNRSTRSLWDPTYVDQSWIASTGIDGGKVNLINRMKAWVNTYYPSTKIGITEYNWGAEGHMNGATTQADIWGIFGRESLDLANRWTTPATGSPAYLAMKLYRNYDGQGHAFGNTSVSASVTNPDQVSAFASIRSSDGALTIVVNNKNLISAGASTSITINLDHFNSTGVAQAWQLAAINPNNLTNAAITHLSDVTFSDNSFTITSPNQSVEMFVLMPAAGTPSAPTGVTATPGNGQVSLSWNSVPGAMSYNIYRGTSPGGEGATVYQSTTNTTFNDTGVTNGTTYYYQVAAVNGAGVGPRSVEVSAKPQAPAPAAPIGLVAVPGNAIVNLSWSATVGAVSYSIYRGTTSGSETLFQSGVTGTTFQNISLTNGTKYYYQITAVNTGGESPKSSEVSATPQVPAPSAPSGLTATPGNAIVNLSWSAAVGAVSYSIYRGITSGSETLFQSGVIGTTFQNTGLTNGTKYYYQITAVNPGGESTKSSEVSATPQVPAPSAPIGLTATPGNAIVNLAWSATVGAVSYSIYRGITSGSETLFQSGVTATSFQNTGLTNGTKYYYQITAVNPGGESPRSIEVSATPQSPTSPPPPPPPPVLIGSHEFAAGNGAAGTVRFFNPDGSERFNLNVFPGFTGGIRTASGDFTGDGIADLVVGTGPGGPTHVKVFNGATQAVLFSVDPFEAAFTGGVYVAAGDINGDGVADLVITPDEGGGPRVRAFTGNSFTQIADFFGIDDPKFRGGARSAIGDLNGDGSGDLVVVAGFGGGPRVAAFDGKQLQSKGGPKLFNDFFAFEQAQRNGIFVAAGDVNSDGFADLVAGGGPGGGPRVYILDGKSLIQDGSSSPVPLGNFFAGNQASRGGVRVAVKNLDDDAKADIVTGAGTGAGTRVTAYLGKNITPTGTPSTVLDYDAFPGFANGVFVG